METIIKFCESNPNVFFGTIVICFIVITYVLLMLFVAKNRNDKLNQSLNNDNEDAGDQDEDEDDEDSEERFFTIPSDELPEKWGETFDIIVDKETKVQYLSLTEGYGLTPLIDSDGKPILYEDED